MNIDCDFKVQKQLKNKDTNSSKLIRKLNLSLTKNKNYSNFNLLQTLWKKNQKLYN